MGAPAQVSYRGSGACERVRRTGVEGKGGGGTSTEKCRGGGRKRRRARNKQVQT